MMARLKQLLKLLITLPASALKFLYFSYESILNNLISGYGYNLREKFINHIDSESKTVVHQSPSGISICPTKLKL
jgi:hypothetical protein